MPPSYKELPVQIPQGLIGDTFNQKAIDFTDAEKIQAALRAQELNNQAVQLSVDAKQRQADQEKELRDALIAQYGADAPTDPNDPNANKYDPIEGYKTAQRISLQHGDLAAAKDAAMAQRSLQGGIQDRPLTDIEAVQLDVPPGTTLAVANSMLRSRNLGISAGNLDARNRGLNEAVDKRSDAIQSYAPGGYEANIDEKGQGPGKKDGELFTVAITAHDRINNDLDMLEQSFANSDPNDPTAPEFLKQKALLGDIQIALKQKNNFGAALTANEERLNNATNPVVLARPDVGAGTALINAGLGRDPLDSINNMRVILGADLESQAFRYKFKKSSNRPAPSFDPNTNSPGDISGAMDRSGAGTAGTPEVAGSGTLPRNADGSPLSREQFMALRNKGN